MPPMNVRMAREINDQLGKKAIIDGYVEVPVFTYQGPTFNDDITPDGCNYVISANHYC